MATDAEKEAVVETLVNAADEAINDSTKFSRADSAEMWGYLATEARSWQQQITAEMEDDEGNDDAGD